jgi:hypothetical protein
MTGDPELAAMAQVAEALDPLDPDATGRVLRWAADRYGQVGLVAGSARASGGPSPGGLGGETSDAADIHDLFGQAHLRTDHDRALLVAYWFQHHQAASAFTGQQINNELKQMGFGASNITHVLNRLINQRPSLAQQVSKSGRAKQARKQYRLTRAGLDAARSLLEREAHDDT